MTLDTNGYPLIVVDVDGTLTKVGDRVKCLEQKPANWDEFYDRCGEDEPVQPIIDLVNKLQLSHFTVFLTGRRESCRDATMLWFRQNHVLGPDALLMRPDDDFRHDTILKPELLKQHGISADMIAFALEDRNSMVAKWRELGVTCLQVAEGDF